MPWRRRDTTPSKSMVSTYFIGRRDPYFLPAGALAFQRDVLDARVTFFPTGHFALETHADEIAAEIIESLTGKAGAAASSTGIAAT